MNTGPEEPIGNGWGFEKRLLFAITVVFIVLNAGLSVIAVPPEVLIAADSLTFHRMAEQLLATGAFAEEQRQPLYPLLMASAIRLGGENGLALLIAAQIAMLYGTGLISWAIARPWLDRGAGAVFCLVVLNPNAVGAAHWPLADTLHALIFTVAVWALLSYGLRGRMWLALVCGAALGLAAMTRPESTLLVFLLPIAIPLVHWLAKRPRPIRTGLPAGIAAMAIAMAVALPWALHNNAAGSGLAMTGGSKASDSAVGHYAIAEAARTGSTEQAVAAALRQAEPAVLANAGLADADPAEQRQYLTSYYLGRLMEVDPELLLGLYAKAWVAQFVSGGAQSLNTLIGLEVERGDKIMNEPGATAAFFEGLQGQPLASLITMGAVGFAVLARILGLAGLVVIALRRHWPLLLVIVCVLLFKGLVHMFFGLSRYRLPVEPLLMILAVFGWQSLRSLRKTRS